MFDWFTGLWPLVSHAGLGGGLIVGLLAAAWFSPVFKREFAYAAGVVAIVMVVYAVGVRDEKVRRDALEAQLQQQIEEAVKNSTGKKDPFDDERL